MNVEEYISSGILEAYVLGDLSLEEMRDVEAKLKVYPELKEELAKIEAASEQLLLKASIAPRVSVKTALFEKIESEKEIRVIPLRQESMIWRYAAAASIVFGLFSSFLAYTYWSRWQESQSNLTQLLAQNQRIAQDYSTVQNRLEEIETEVRITTNPDFERVVMKGTPNAPQSIASVYWNAHTKEVYLRIQNMKALSKENQYQLWAIIDGKPVDCGVFDSSVAGLLKMKAAIQFPTTFAVTIEPRGGKSSPSLETMQVAGNVAKV
ncbi:MAG: anti-sigma factor domain-containing protein [Cyclobacteriaceae bacterium]|nr:anti-sigma factor [Flammeovirgaceae bacterium]